IFLQSVFCIKNSIWLPGFFVFVKKDKKTGINARKVVSQDANCTIGIENYIKYNKFTQKTRTDMISVI
ncbi:MAG: hypothetical protein LIP11_11200, partial [Clostridiales bacterium]|nr:hypothetical protein [Clostridiales bacterium]